MKLPKKGKIKEDSTIPLEELKEALPEEELKEPVPESIQTRLNSLLENGESVLLAASSDMRYDGSYQNSWLFVTDKRLMILDPSLAMQIELKEIESVGIRSFVGNSVLEVETDGEKIEVLKFSASLTDKFFELIPAIEALSNEDESIEERVQRAKSAKANQAQKTDRISKEVKTRKMLGRLMQYIKPYWYLLALGIIISVLLTAVGLAPVYLRKILIDRVLVPKENLDLLFKLVLALVGIRLGSMILHFVRGVTLGWLGQKISMDLRMHIYNHLQKLSLSFYDSHQSGRIMSRVTSDTGQLRGFIVDGVQNIIINSFTLIGIAIILLYMNLKLAASILIPVPLMIVGTYIFGKKIYEVYRRARRKWAGVYASLSDSLSGIRVVQAFSQEERERKRFSTENLAFFDENVTAIKMYNIFEPLMGFATFIGSIIIWIIGGQEVIGDALTLGEFTAFTGYMWRFYGPVNALCRVNNMFQSTAASADRVFEILDTEPDVKEASDAKEVGQIDGHIKFHNVSFGYNKDELVLKNINFEAQPKEMIGLVGASGSGKTTLVNLIPRFYDPTEGQITLDGNDLKDLEIKSLRNQMGMVLQDSFLFHGSIRENIAYGKPSATDEDIIAAAKSANAHDFIMKMPDGYDTEVGERGTRLSGGQRQRISIARAILIEPRILILDEATSAVDTETEKLIQEALEKLMKDRTTFAIAHRLSTVKEADKLLVMDGGEIVEIGKHDELIEQGGSYAKLVEMQALLSEGSTT
jgi:ATP-binding cassette subfamily B protein